MNIFEQLIHNHILITSGIAWLISQIFKIIINLIVEKHFVWERLFGDGGMPSGHSATVTCLAVLCGWYEGYDSVLFAVAMLLAIIVMHDAMGVRRETGKQAATIKELADALNQLFVNKDAEIKTEKLKLLVGHSPIQVFFGAVTGFLVALVHILIF